MVFMWHSLRNTPDKFIFHLTRQEVQVRVMPLARVRKATLRYDMKNQEFKIRVPLHYKKAAVEGFLREAQEWMEKQILQAPQLVPIYKCRKVSVMGNEVELKYYASRRTSFLMTDDKLHIMGPTPNFGPVLEKWFKQMILEYFQVKSNHYSVLLGVKVKKVGIREARTRWGSCSAHGSLSYNWRLIFAPKEVIDYVIAHEVAHLKEMNHSLKFWRLVAQLHPKSQEARHWLKKNGSELFTLQFHE